MESALEQLNEENNGVVLQDAAAASAPLQAVPRNQLAAAPDATRRTRPAPIDCGSRPVELVSDPRRGWLLLPGEATVRSTRK